LSDSTNVEQHGTTPGEDAVVPAFAEALETTHGRLVVTCFATSIPRIQRVSDLALAAGRNIAFLGRRMADNAEVALELGALKVPEPRMVSAHALMEQPPHRLAVFVSGSQGEPFSAFTLLSLGEQRDLAVGPGD